MTGRELEVTETAGFATVDVPPTSVGVALDPESDAASAQQEGAVRTATPEAAVEDVDGLLDEVEDALSRLDDGTYGECATCARPIDDGLLADDPTTQQCAACRGPDDG